MENPFIVLDQKLNKILSLLNQSYLIVRDDLIRKPEPLKTKNRKTYWVQKGIYYQQKRELARKMKIDGFTIDEIIEETGLSRGAVSKYTTDITTANGRNGWKLKY